MFNLKTKITDECIDMRAYLLERRCGGTIKIVTKDGDIPLSDILFPLLDEEDLWNAFIRLKFISSQPIA